MNNRDAGHRQGPVLWVVALTVAALGGAGVVLAIVLMNPAWFGRATASPTVGTSPATSDERDPAAPPAVAPENPNPDDLPAAFKAGDRLVVMPGDKPPSPLLGVPVASPLGRPRLQKLLAADDHLGLLAEADGSAIYFCRVGTAVTVIEVVRQADDEPWAEVRLTSGAYAGKSGWVPVSGLGRWRLSEKLAKELNEERWPKAKRKAIARDYFLALEESLREAAAEVGGRFDPEGKLAVRTKRVEVEKAAMKRFLENRDMIMKRHDVDFAGELDAIVIAELAGGEVFPFVDR